MPGTARFDDVHSGNLHAAIEEHRREPRDGDMIDIEFILDETTEPKHSERETAVPAGNI
jgi:hypothetical protein